MEFTGERYVPGTPGIEDLYLEHVSRYVYASGLARGRRVLDVGCGCGYGSYRLALGGAVSVLGADVSEEAIGFASERYRHPALRFRVADAARMEVGDRFDLVTCFEMIEHVDDAPEVLRRIAGAMSGDGVLLVSTPNKDLYVGGDGGGTNRFHRREYTRDEFRDLLERHFPHVAVWGQHWAESIVVLPPEAGGSGVTAELLEDDGSGGGALSLGDPLYFVAVCAASEGGLRAATELGTLATVAGPVRYRDLKRHLRDLRAEFDKRGKWARSLDEEIGRRDETIRTLQAEIATLRGSAETGAAVAAGETTKEKA